jgi:hypothetical protein
MGSESSVYLCKRDKHIIKEECRDSSCVWQIISSKYLNCTWVACNYGPFSCVAVAAMMGVTKEWIGQIESRALAKIKRKIGERCLKDYIDRGEEGSLE